MEKRQVLNNLPPIGSDNNKGYVTSSQMNIANVEAWESERTQMDDKLGVAGVPHVDIADDPMSMTAMLCLSELPPGYSPGFFFLLEFGFFSSCDRYRVLVFSGLNRHAGSSP